MQIRRTTCCALALMAVVTNDAAATFCVITDDDTNETAVNALQLFATDSPWVAACQTTPDDITAIRGQLLSWTGDEFIEGWDALEGTVWYDHWFTPQNFPLTHELRFDLATDQTYELDSTLLLRMKTEPATSDIGLVIRSVGPGRPTIRLTGLASTAWDVRINLLIDGVDIERESAPNGTGLSTVGASGQDNDLHSPFVYLHDVHLAGFDTGIRARDVYLDEVSIESPNYDADVVVWKSNAAALPIVSIHDSVLDSVRIEEEVVAFANQMQVNISQVEPESAGQTLTTIEYTEPVTTADGVTFQLADGALAKLGVFLPGAFFTWKALSFDYEPVLPCQTSGPLRIEYLRQVEAADGSVSTEWAFVEEDFEFCESSADVSTTLPWTEGLEDTVVHFSPDAGWTIPLRAYDGLSTNTFELPVTYDNDGDGYTWPEDCSDQNASIHPGAEEVCDNVDNNCNGIKDEGATYVDWHVDSDGDGFGTPSIIKFCADAPPTSGYSLFGTDCNDQNKFVHPNAPEACDNADNNCNGAKDEGLPTTLWWFDGDGDGFGAGAPVLYCTGFVPSGGLVLPAGDCHDGNVSINPSAPELCDDGVDNNCNGLEDTEEVGVCGPAWVCPTGDITGDGLANINDVQCGVLNVLAQLSGEAVPACVSSAASSPDQNCDGSENITDVVILIGRALGSALPASIDADADACVDTCQP